MTSAQNECELYEAAEAKVVCPKANADSEMPQSGDFTYDYAVPEEHVRNHRQRHVEKVTHSSKESIMLQNGNADQMLPVYHVLEN